jgi:hypothetical protein
MRGASTTSEGGVALSRRYDVRLSCAGRTPYSDHKGSAERQRPSPTPDARPEATEATTSRAKPRGHSARGSFLRRHVGSS